MASSAAGLGLMSQPTVSICPNLLPASPFHRRTPGRPWNSLEASSGPCQHTSGRHETGLRARAPAAAAPRAPRLQGRTRAAPPGPASANAFAPPRAPGRRPAGAPLPARAQGDPGTPPRPCPEPGARAGASARDSTAPGAAPPAGAHAGRPSAAL